LRKVGGVDGLANEFPRIVRSCGVIGLCSGRIPTLFQVKIFACDAFNVSLQGLVIHLRVSV